MYLDDVKINTTIELPPVVMEKEQMFQFAKLYDPLPLHLDEEYAKNTRFGALIAPGVMSFMAVWGRFAEMDTFGDALVAGKSTNIQWFKPVYMGDTLYGTIRYTNITRRNAYNGTVEITMDVFNQHGEQVITSVTESVVKYRQDP